MEFNRIPREVYERRIARRVAPDSLRLELEPPGKGGGLLRRKHRPIECTVLDMSVTGARILVPRSARYRARAQMTFGVKGWSGVAEVIRVSDGPEPGQQVLAVEFRSLSPALEEVVHDIVAGDRKKDDWRWYVAS